MKRVGLVGVTGYTGMELIRVLLGHPDMRLTQVTSRKEAGQTLREIYPFLQERTREICALSLRTARSWLRTVIWYSWPFLTVRPWRWPPSCGKKACAWWT